MFAFWESGEEGVEGGTAHVGRVEEITRRADCPHSKLHVIYA